MSDKEQMSALVDGELSGEERQALLAKLLADPESRSTYDRYRLSGDLIRQQGRVTLNHNFAESVSRALESEPTVLAPKRPDSNRWLRPVSGLAVAASVAALAIYIAPALTPDTQLDSMVPQVAERSLTTPDPAPLQLVSESRRVSEAKARRIAPEMEQKLNHYLVNHGEYASGNDMNSVLPYAAVVSYDLGQ